MELNTPFIESGERSSRRESEPPKEPTPCSGPIFDDVPWWRPPGAPKHHIYQQYFTPAERLRLEAIPENDVTSEIRLLRVLSPVPSPRSLNPHTIRREPLSL
jgi:hypothetical protein